MGINPCSPSPLNKQNGEQQLGINLGSPNEEQQLGINLGSLNGGRQMGINPCPPVYLMDLMANDNWASTQVHQIGDNKWASTHVHRAQPIRPEW
jgi:hypothetical protein